jgi:uroporphyrinogen decarboxylase
VDTRGLFPLNSHNLPFDAEDGGDYWLYRDEWGIVHRRPKGDGLYYSIWQVPLPHDDVSVQEIERYPWPDMGAVWRFAGLREQAQRHRAAGYAVVLKDGFAGIFEFAQRMVGMENLLVMMALRPEVAEALFDQLLALKLAYWQSALAELGELVDVVTYADDYGSQASQIISPRMFRRLLKPRVQQVFELQARLAPHAYRFFHSDGNVRPLLPDMIEIGVQILNPIHIRAAGMEPAALKRDFGRDLVFWGGGVDTQGVLPNGTAQEVKEDVRRNVAALAPGGGYVFNTIHNIQADVPATNVLAMVEALREVSP